MFSGDFLFPIKSTGLEVGEHTFEVRAIDAADNVGDPASYTWTILALPEVNTPVGTAVTVVLGSVTVTFDGVTVEGVTTVETLASVPPLPEGYLQAGALFYDIDTTATYIGPVSVCFSYTPGALDEPVRLLHYDGDWNDITTSWCAPSTRLAMWR